MAGEETIAALLAIWDKGSSSARWPELLPVLLQLVDQFQQSTDDDTRAEIAMRITDLLRDTDPDLYRTLIQMRKAMRAGEAHNRFSTRGMPSGAELSATWQETRTREAATHGESITTGNISGTGITTGNISGTGIAVGQGAQATVHQHFYEPRFTRYTDISCPRRVQVNSRVTVTVALTMQPQPESVALQAIEVFEGKVRVRIDAPGFEPLSPLEQTIIVERDDDSAPVVFHLKARETGQHEIVIQFWQRGNLIATVVAPIEVLEMAPVFSTAFVPTTPVSPRMAEVTPPDLTLVIFRDPAGRMQFTLHRDNITLFYAEQTLPRPPDALLNALFDELHLLQRGADSANRRRGSSLLTAEQVERRIRNLGYKLWDDLIPPELKLYYARERHQWQSAIAAGQRWSLLVQSNEPDIPWELVRPYSDGPDCWEEDFWCQTFHFARWLLKRPDSPESVVPLPRLRLRTLAAIVPTCYPELKAVPEEHKLLRDLIARYRLTDRSPQRATEPAVIALLETGGFDWLHVITHGDFFAQSALHSSAIGLDDNQWLASSAITGPRIRSALRNHRPAIILNACHVGREQPSLSGAAGWVTQFVGSGAGIMIAPLWSVNDEFALRFSEVFYAALLHPDRPATVAEAMWQARNAIRQPDDPTWLAYSLFAHPNARVEVQPLQA
jgi:hypothetical protein